MSGMKYNLVRKEIREGMWKFTLGTLLLSVTAVLIPFGYEMIIDFLSSGGEEQLGRFLPDTSVLKDHSLYVWSQWSGKNLYQIGTILAIILGMNAVAGEVSGRTMDFLLTRPISRRKVLLTKMAVGVFLLFSAVFISTAVLLFASGWFFPSINYSRLIGAVLLTTLGLFVIYFLSFLLSILIDEPIKAGVTSGLILLINSIPGWFSATRSLSFFSHMRGAKYFIEGRFPLLSLFIIVFLGTCFVVLADLCFAKKEL